MKERITISISTIHGSKYWHLSRSLSRTLMGFMAISLVTVSCGVLLIQHLHLTLNEAQLQQKELTNKSQLLNDELTNLQDLNKNLVRDILKRDQRITLVSEQLSHVEKALGEVDHDANIDLESRLDVAVIQSNLRMMMLNTIPSGSPVGKHRISSQFGKRIHPVTNKMTMHNGLDFAVNTGTPIYAPADGVVEATRQSDQGSGNYLRLLHSFGFSSSYSHLKSFKVKERQFVRKGDLIAISGNTGLSSGPHLHYEVRFVGRALNPRPFVDWNIHNFEDIYKKERSVQWAFLVKIVEKRVTQQVQLSLPRGVQSTGRSN